VARSNPRSLEPARRATRSLVALLLVVISLGCEQTSSGVSRELHELERLAFLPVGRAYFPGYREPYDVFSIERPLLVDRYEATVGDWQHYFGPELPWMDSRAQLEEEPESWPVSLTLHEAQALAEARGMRLLLAREWIYCAVGSRSHPFPWGQNARSSAANTLELGLGGPASVGTFENGANPYGCYDLLGNVWEWVEGQISSWRSPPPNSAWAMGGSWLSHMRPVYALPEAGPSRIPVFNQIAIDELTRSRDIGVRHCADAREYLLAKSKSWGTNGEAERRLIAIGERFGEEALELIEELSELPDAAPGLGWLAEGARR